MEDSCVCLFACLRKNSISSHLKSGEARYACVITRGVRVVVLPSCVVAVVVAAVAKQSCERRDGGCYCEG